MYPLAVLSHLRPPFAYILGYYGHARLPRQGERQSSAVKPPLHRYTTTHRDLAKSSDSLVCSFVYPESIPGKIPPTTCVIYWIGYAFGRVRGRHREDGLRKQASPGGFHSKGERGCRSGSSDGGRQPRRGGWGGRGRVETAQCTAGRSNRGESWVMSDGRCDLLSPLSTTLPLSWCTMYVSARCTSKMVGVLLKDPL